MVEVTRRQAGGAIAGAAALGAAGARAGAGWKAGAVVHLLPAASSTEFLIKVSLNAPYADGLILKANDRRFKGERTDSAGRFWRFRAVDLVPGTTYDLAIEHKRRALCDPWPLRTFPDPSSSPQSFRLLTFTCAGGLEGAKSLKDTDAFRPLAIRRRLLDRGLSFKPHAVIANGDHIYWDQKAWLEHPHPEIRQLTRAAYDRFGYFDRAAPIFGTPNEALIERLASPQIASLYGVRLRSTPVFFVSDDHDYFENDDATPTFVAFPPDEFQVRAARAVQRLFYPEFLPDQTRPDLLPGASACENGPGVSEAFGTLRFGDLFEAAIFDCGRFLTLKGPSAGLVPPEAEAWLIARAKAEETGHFAFVPSHPMGWTAGKWREWYPDVVAQEGGASGDSVVVSTHREGATGKLTTAREKYFWQKGWFDQHQRLAAALSGQQRRAAMTLSGDLHAIGYGAITRSGDRDFGANPIHTILAGPIGTSGAGWPSFARGTRPEPSALIGLEQSGPPLEKNGFTLIDATPDQLVVRQFAWREPDPVAAIDTLEPFATHIINRRDNR